MKNFPCSPRTNRQSTGSPLLSIQRSEAMNRRTLSPSMPKGGHVLSIKSSWENRSKLPLDSSSSTRYRSEQHDQDNSKSLLNRSTTSKTMNTRSSYSTAHDQENGGDYSNRSISRGTSHKPTWEDKYREQRSATKKSKDSAWVKQTDTDDTTSLSSRSNEISIGKTLSNISDVSAHSSQGSSWRYKSRPKYGVESYTSRYGDVKSSRASSQLANKLANESCSLHKIHSDESSTLNYSLGKLSSEDGSGKLLDNISSEDETSKFNYPLERLSEGGEEESYSRPSLGSRYEGDKRIDMHKNEAKEQCAGETKEMYGSFQTFMDRSSRLSEKISSVPSTDSSLVYSIGNTAEPYDLKKFSYSYSCDMTEDLKASDLVASTLAECRLLLELSPPPTPLGGVRSPMAKRGFDASSPIASAKKSSDFKQDYTIESPVAAAMKEKTETPPTLLVKNSPPVASSPANSSVDSVGLGSFLKCPCCHKEFTNDTSSNENRECQPLHSFACDHIVCFGCVFATPSTHMVECPKCGEENAFDKTKPVVSRSYCNLVKSIEILNSAKKGSAEKIRRSGGDKKEKYERSEGGCNERADVPRQIRFSPVKEVPTKSNDTIEVKATETNALEKQHDDVSGMSELTVNTSPYPEEPATPVSRAEFRFMQRKEKLAQSLERVNRLLEKSKMSRNEFALKSIEEDLSEMKSVDDVTSVIDGAMNSSISNKENETGEIKHDDGASESPKTNNGDNQETLNESVRVVGDIVDSAGFERPTINTLWTDEAVCLSQPQGQSAQKRIKPELRVDTGNYTPTPLQQCKNPYLDLKDETIASCISETKSRSTEIQSKNDSLVSSVNDIFRGHPMSPRMNFGVLENRISSEDSSMTDRDSDNRFLLGKGVASKSGGNSLMKEKKYGLHRPSPLKDFAMSSEKQRTDEHRCPQFLPSLTYSTMQESDELVGLVREKNGMSRRGGGSRRFNAYSVTPSKIFRPSTFDESNLVKMFRPSRSCKGARLSFGKAESFDERSLVRNQPYEFAQHSCSFSPSSLRGALVTHKPKLHKRIISKFRFKSKGQRLYVKK